MENNSALLEIMHLLLYAHENEDWSTPPTGISILKERFVFTEDDGEEGDKYY